MDLLIKLPRGFSNTPSLVAFIEKITNFQLKVFKRGSFPFQIGIESAEELNSDVEYNTPRRFWTPLSKNIVVQVVVSLSGKRWTNESTLVWKIKKSFDGRAVWYAGRITVK